MSTFQLHTIEQNYITKTDLKHRKQFAQFFHTPTYSKPNVKVASW